MSKLGASTHDHSCAAAGASSVPELAVNEALVRILASSEFAVSARNRAFLQFIVNETLAGRSKRIKAYTVAVEVFGRGENFDPQNDPVVRIEAGRLRRALEHYYLSAGRDDEVVIHIPKGSYIPAFALRPTEAADQPAAPAPASVPTEPDVAVSRPEGLRNWWRCAPRYFRVTALVLVAAGLMGLGYITHPLRTPGQVADAIPLRPSIVVLPFSDLMGETEQSLLSRGFADELITQLTRFKEIIVYGRGTGAVMLNSDDPAQFSRELGVAYSLEGSIGESAGHLRASVRLLNVRSNEIVWAETFLRDLDAGNLLALQQQIAGDVATRIAQPYGIVAQASDRQAASMQPDDMAAYRCGLQFYAYRAELRPDAYARAKSCLEVTTELYPAYATGWAMLAYIYIDEDRFWSDGEAQTPAPLDRALDAAKRAVALDPNDVRAWQALMMAHFFHSDVAKGVYAGERGLAINPNDTEFLGEFGMRLAMMGEWERGTSMVREALARDPANSPFYRSVLAWDLFRVGKYEEALEEVHRIGMIKLPLYYAVRAAILGQLGRTEEAAEDGRRFLKEMPGFFDRLETELSKRNMQPEFRQKIIEGLRKAGLPVPETVTRAPGMAPVME
ncbi:tetratricopeptide repeat protein [Geminicoccus flavidas]|uniref:tetratricopeptide repeat protein n=1 Tax=Geminicoccus flavidas TaxID=2506407 RepID=UPI001358957F|nr:adenylate cyclase [Geminicoccus flavidas]